MKTTLFFLCAFLVPSPASAAGLSREETVLQSRRVESTESRSLVQPVDRLVARADATVAKGLEARTSSQSIAAFRHAEHAYTEALHRIDRLVRQHPGDVELTGALGALRGRARDGAVQASIDAGHVFLARADYQDALKEADKAVSIDPEDALALEFRDTASMPGDSLLGVLPLRTRGGFALPFLGPALGPRAMIAMPATR